MNQGSPAFDLVAESGVGRPFVLVFEEARDEAFARHVFDHLSAKTRTLLLRAPTVTDDNWAELTAALLDDLKNRGLRQVSFVGFGAACVLVQNACLTDARFIRTAVFVRGSSRAHPSRLSRIVDRIERSLPLGLPLRLVEQGFDSRSYLQRIRCPALVVTLPGASLSERRDAEAMARRMPTAWGIGLPESGAAEELGRTVLAFSDVPAKCPQKNQSAAS